MRLSEKKFICDVASIILAIGVLICGVLIAVNYELFHGAVPMIFGCGALMFLALFFRNRYGKNPGRMAVHLLLAAVLVVFTIISVLFPGGVR